MGDEASHFNHGDGKRESKKLLWQPRQNAFLPYYSSEYTYNKTEAVRKPILSKLTKDIVKIYQICNPSFKYSEDLNPKRYLTSPSIGAHNDGYDNANSDLILNVNYVLVNIGKQRRYVVKDILGHGTFGQVAKCWVAETRSFVAVKIIKNQPAYYQQALVEVSILTTLNDKYDPEDRHHIVRVCDYFVYQHHLCISFELLDSNLYELIKMNNFRGLSLTILQLFTKQILDGLALMKDAGIIHCDLKPENILLCTSMKPAAVKIIDFGSACMEDRTVYSYIQSRYYRSPEVLLGYQYTTAIDMWSFGCIVAELFLGLPLFPGASEFDLLRRMIKLLGGQPPDHILKDAKNTYKYFKCIGSVHLVESGGFCMGVRSAFQSLTVEEYEAREATKPTIGKEYFNHINLEEIVKNYPYRKNLPQEDMVKESRIRLALVDFLRGLVEFDPAKRWSPLQASKHPFVTGEPFTCPYKPLLVTPRKPISQNIKIDHHPGGGHWFAAGLSPNIHNLNRTIRHNSTHYQMMPQHAHDSSYGSLGSQGGSYSDGIGLGTSYGSYGDNNHNMFAYFSPVVPSGMTLYPQGGTSTIGTSPDGRWKFIQHPHVHGIGSSLSMNNFPQLPLGASPSQFNHPNSYSDLSAGSPGHYGPTSPAKGSSNGSPLGKMAAASQFSRRKSLEYSQEGPSSQWQGYLLVGCPIVPNMQGSNARGSYLQYPRAPGPLHDKLEVCSQSPPKPGDWFPNYSDELLLEEDNSESSHLAAEFGKGLHISQGYVSQEPLVGVGRFNHATDTSRSSAIPTQRSDGNVESFAHVESSPTHDLRGGYGLPKPKSLQFMPHGTQNSPSRLSQQHVPRLNPIRSTDVRGGSQWNHVKVHPPGFFSGGPTSPGNNTLNNGMPWGRRPGKGPPSHGRKDYGRID